MSDIHTLSDNITYKASFNGATANSTQTGTAINTQGYRRATAVFTVTPGGSTSTINIGIVECATSGGSYSSAITGSTLGTALAAGSGLTSILVDIDLSKRLQYLKPQIVGTGTDGFAAVGFLLINDENLGVSGLQDTTPQHI